MQYGLSVCCIDDSGVCGMYDFGVRVLLCVLRVCCCASSTLPGWSTARAWRLCPQWLTDSRDKPLPLKKPPQREVRYKALLCLYDDMEGVAPVRLPVVQ